MPGWVPRDVTIPIRYWGFGIGIGGSDRYWYLSVLVLASTDGIMLTLTSFFMFNFFLPHHVLSFHSRFSFVLLSIVFSFFVLHLSLYELF